MIKWPFYTSFILCPMSRTLQFSDRARETTKLNGDWSIVFVYDFEHANLKWHLSTEARTRRGGNLEEKEL